MSAIWKNYQSNILPLLTLPTGVIQSQINKMQVIITIYVSQGKVFSFPNDNLFILPKRKLSLIQQSLLIMMKSIQEEGNA